MKWDIQQVWHTGGLKHAHSFAVASLRLYIHFSGEDE
jgi:acid phosphatase family membrane protein YuiD